MTVSLSNGTGEAVAYALGPLEERGILFVGVGEALYEGMIIGENAKPEDLEVNPNNKRTAVVKEVFANSFNYMKNGTQLRKVINKINR